MNKDPFKVVSALLLFAGLTPWSSPLMAQASVAEVHAQQQSNVCNGLVTDQHGEPIIGASVVIKGTTKGSVTGLDGEFSIANASKGATIVISYIGYVSQEKVWNGKAMKVVLEEDSKALDEVVVVGYGTTSKRKTTSAISQVKAEDIAKVPVPNITQSLAGRAPGLIVTQSGGGVNAKASVSIRGGGTPLYVIDNVICEQRDFQNLNPEDIAQMSILKDASATAVYGARAANGIIMITTKSGEAGKLNIDYSFNYTMSQPADLQKKVDAFTAASFVNRGLQYDGRAPQYTEHDLELFRNGSDPQGHANVDWQKVTMRNVAPEMRHNLILSGGSEAIKIYTGLGYYHQQSIYKVDSHHMNRYNFRTNLEANLKKIGLKVDAGVDAYIVDFKEPSTANGRGYYTTWSHIQNKKPWEPAYNQFGQIYGGTTDNALIDISNQGGYFKQSQSSVRGHLNLTWAIPYIKGLSVRSLSSYTLANDRNKSWNKSAQAYDWDGNPLTANKPNLSKNVYAHQNFNQQLFADYTHTFKELHTLGATLGIEASGQDYDNLGGSRKEYIFDVDQMSAGPAETMENWSSEGVGYRRAAVIGRLKYDYASRYMVEANLRYDGSDFFPKGQRWGAFFSGSAAWAISEEAFWKKFKMDKVLEHFKLRASYGEIGQDFLDLNGDGSADRFAYVSSYTLYTRGAFLGGKWRPTFYEGALISPDMTWYTTKDFNIGVDFTSLKGRLSGSLDYFAKVTTGYLATPSNVGYTAPLGKNLPVVKSNGESIRRGFEFILQWRDHIGEFNYGISGNMTYYDDRWNVNPNEAETNLKNPYKRSTQAGAYTGVYYRNLGYYQDYQDVLNSPKRNGSTNLMAGDLKYYDFNGDGKIDGDDQTRMGSGTSPRANFGLNADASYKGWSFSMLWQGATNYNIYVDNILMGGNSNYLPVIYDFQKDIWSPENRNTLYPRQHASPGFNGSNNFVGTNFWLVDAYYLRLKSMSIGYDLKHKLLKHVGWMTKCNLSLSGYNLLTFSPAKKWGFDPESGSNGNGYGYPISRVYTISLNIGF